MGKYLKWPFTGAEWYKVTLQHRRREPRWPENAVLRGDEQLPRTVGVPPQLDDSRAIAAMARREPGGDVETPITGEEMRDALGW